MEPDTALIAAVPVVKPETRPVVLTVAMLVAEELQVTELVRFWVVPLL